MSHRQQVDIKTAYLAPLQASESLSIKGSVLAVAAAVAVGLELQLGLELELSSWTAAPAAWLEDPLAWWV